MIGEVVACFGQRERKTLVVVTQIIGLRRTRRSAAIDIRDGLLLANFLGPYEPSNLYRRKTSMIQGGGQRSCFRSMVSLMATGYLGSFGSYNDRVFLAR